MVGTHGCIFCAIIAGALPATIIAQTEDLLVIKDIFPKSPIHYLIIPKKHIPSIQKLQRADLSLMGAIALMAQELSAQLEGSQDFRLLENDGPDAGQSVSHLHFHFLAGKKMHDF